MPLAYAQKIYNNILEKKNSHPHHKKYFMHGCDIGTYDRMNVTLQGGQTLPGMQGTINSNHMSGTSQLMHGFPLKSSQPYSPSR